MKEKVFLKLSTDLKEAQTNYEGEFEQLTNLVYSACKNSTLLRLIFETAINSLSENDLKNKLKLEDAIKTNQNKFEC